MPLAYLDDPWSTWPTLLDAVPQAPTLISVQLQANAILAT